MVTVDRSVLDVDLSVTPCIECVHAMATVMCRSERVSYNLRLEQLKKRRNRELRKDLSYKELFVRCGRVAHSTFSCAYGWKLNCVQRAASGILQFQ
jgi:hypothetical protein